jgi:hypothetical protein
VSPLILPELLSHSYSKFLHLHSFAKEIGAGDEKR